MKLEFKDYTMKQAAEKYFLPEYEEPAEHKIAVFTVDKPTNTGHIHWMENMNQLKDFILNLWFPVLTEDRNEQYYRQMERIKKELEEADDYKTIMEITESNPFDDATVEWIGSLDELIRSDDWIPSQMRDHFNEDQPITEENKQEFIDFLRDYVWG